MIKGKYLFTSESVCAGHPDKVCDQISDSILDACLAQDPDSRVAIETLTKTGMVLVAGELTTKAYVNIPTIVRQTLKEIGYTSSHFGIEYEMTVIPYVSHGLDEIKKRGTDGVPAPENPLEYSALDIEKLKKLMEIQEP